MIIGTADRFRVIGPNAALAVGGTIALAGLIALPIEGASMNPARSLGPAVVSGSLGDLWIYVLGPVLGAVAAVGIARFLHGPRRTTRRPRRPLRVRRLAVLVGLRAIELPPKTCFVGRISIAVRSTLAGRSMAWAMTAATSAGWTASKSS